MLVGIPGHISHIYKFIIQLHRTLMHHFHLFDGSRVLRVLDDQADGVGFHGIHNGQMILLNQIVAVHLHPFFAIPGIDAVFADVAAVFLENNVVDGLRFLQVNLQDSVFGCRGSPHGAVVAVENVLRIGIRCFGGTGIGHHESVAHVHFPIQRFFHRGAGN